MKAVIPVERRNAARKPGPTILGRSQHAEIWIPALPG